MQQLDPTQRQLLIKTCAGNPLFIHLVKVWARENFEDVMIQDVVQASGEIANFMYAKAFERLEPRQKDVLLALSLYNGTGISLETLYKVCKPGIGALFCLVCFVL